MKYVLIVWFLSGPVDVPFPEAPYEVSHETTYRAEFESKGECNEALNGWVRKDPHFRGFCVEEEK